MTTPCSPSPWIYLVLLLLVDWQLFSHLAFPEQHLGARQTSDPSQGLSLDLLNQSLQDWTSN